MSANGDLEHVGNFFFLDIESSAELYTLHFQKLGENTVTTDKIGTHNLLKTPIQVLSWDL